jgi:hypothetical protein
MNTIQQTNPGKNLRSVSIIGVGCTPFREYCADPEFDGLTEGEVFVAVVAEHVSCGLDWYEGKRIGASFRSMLHGIHRS